MERYELKINVYYTNHQGHWAIMEGNNPVILFPGDAAGYQRAAGLLRDVRNATRTMVASKEPGFNRARH